MPNKHPVEKAHEDLCAAARSFVHLLDLIKSGDVGSPTDLTATTAYRRLKDAMKRAEFLAQCATTSEVVL